SVMTTTVAEALKHAISLGLRSANLSSGNDVSKTRWAPREDLYCEVVQVSPTSHGRFAIAAYEQSRRILHGGDVRGSVAGTDHDAERAHDARRVHTDGYARDHATPIATRT
ncbi:MAG TPA: hypothetical protein VF331_23960, partial [Polyangiales bacterium]